MSTRETWKNKADFILALISYGVGLGNVWRFPYLAYSSGGGAFLIPFLISSVVVGIPYALLEVGLGQWMKEGGLGAWDVTPIFKGIGFANLIIVFLGNVYYEVILAWTMRYILASFTFNLPWKTCNHEWNTQCCSESLLYNNVNVSTIEKNDSNFTNIFQPVQNSSNFTNCKKLNDPITEYWERNILEISDGIDNPGGIKIELLLTLIASWVIVFLSIFRGMKNSQIVVYITAILPYLFLFILLIKGLFLPGALVGIKYYLYPDWTKLMSFQVWADAGTQIFYSYGIGIAALVSLGSYNKFHHNSYRDVVIFTFINTLTSVLSGFVIFSILGYMAHVRNIDISLVAEEGPGLAFVVYPAALSLLPWPWLWSIMFFVMLFLLGLGTQVVAAEAITTAIIDEYMHLIKRKLNTKYVKAILSALNVLLSFVCGLPMITRGGMYVFQIFDFYAASRSLLFVGLFEVIAIAYVYGVNRFYKNLSHMWKYPLGPWLKIMWLFATPGFTIILIVFTIMSYQDLTYNRTYKYPTWALTLGWFLSLSSLICIPLYALYKFLRTSGTFKQRLVKIKTPVIKPHQKEYEINHEIENLQSITDTNENNYENNIRNSENDSDTDEQEFNGLVNKKMNEV